MRHSAMSHAATCLARLAAALAVVSSLGCVTINIYFPAAAAEKAADAIIDEVWRMKSARPAEGTAAPETAREKSP